MVPTFSTSNYFENRFSITGCVNSKVFLLLLFLSFFALQNFAEGQSKNDTDNIEAASATDNSTFVLLQWKVKDNVSVDHYEIERMDINGSYSTIAFILSDNNEETKLYKYKDKITVRDLHLFYRIKAVNMNGTEMFCEVMPLDLKSTGDGLVGIEYRTVQILLHCNFHEPKAIIFSAFIILLAGWRKQKQSVPRRKKS